MDQSEKEAAETVTTNLTMPREMHDWIREQAAEKGTYVRREMLDVLRDGRKFREKRK